MAISAFGVDDSRLLSKADRDKRQYSAGRTAAAATFGGYHGAVAGRKGKKVRATANEAVGSLLGTYGGGAAGMLLARKNPLAGAMVGAGVGGAGGAVAGLRRNQRKGYLKRIQHD